MPTVRKVQSKASVPAKEAGGNGVGVSGREVFDPEGSDRRGARVKKACYFCKTGTEPHYFDSVSLRKFVSDRGRISPRGRSGACAKHQRRVSREIKRARLLALLPFTPSI